MDTTITLQKRIERAGFSQIGKGSRAIVFGKGKTVIKIGLPEATINHPDGWLAFAATFCRNSILDFPTTLPKIHKIGKLADDSYYAVMERLDATVWEKSRNLPKGRGFRDSVDRLIFDASWKGFEEVNIAGVMEHIPTLDNGPEFVNLLRRVEEYSNFHDVMPDVHCDNIMFRGNSLVLIDPFLTMKGSVKEHTFEVLGL